MSDQSKLSSLLKLSRAIDAVSMHVGSAVSWLVLLAIFISAANAISRKLFSVSSNAFLEAQWYLFGATFMLSAARVLLRDKHVRVDLIFDVLSPRARNWIDLLGHVFFLLPLCGLMLYYGVPFVMSSLAVNEVSINPGGLIVWPAKLLLPLGFALLMAQTTSEIIKRAAKLLAEDDADDYLEINQDVDQRA